MKDTKKSSEINYSKNQIDEEIEIQEVLKLCNSCKTELPLILDRGICPHCFRIN